MNFLQTAQFSRLREQFGWKTYSSKFGLIWVGGGRIKYIDILAGPQLDFTDSNAVAEFVDYIRKLARQVGAVYVKCMPDAIYQRLTSDGELIDGTQNFDCIIQLQYNKFRHQGFSSQCSGQPRLLYVRDFVEKSYEFELKHFKGSVRTELRKAKEFGLTVKRITHLDQLPEFKLPLEETGQRQGFVDKSLTYYQAVLHNFEERAHFMSVVLNTETATKLVNERILQIQQEMEQLNLVQNKQGRKTAGRIVELQNQLAGQKNRLATIQQLPETGEITICSGLFIETDSELVYLFGGTRSAYLNFSGVYLLQEVMMKYCFNHQISRYNFYGVSSIFDTTDANHGVLAFKQSYRGEILELVGEFILPIKRIKFSLHRLLQLIIQSINKSSDNTPSSLGDS